MKLAVRYLLVVLSTFIATPALAAPVVFHVSLANASTTSVSGRMLVFAKPLRPSDKRPVTSVNIDQIDTHAAAVAAQEVARLEPGGTVDIDADVTAFPTPFSQLTPGRYAVQAVLDRDHSYNYTGRGPGDVVSGVVEMDLPGDAASVLTLATTIPETDSLQPLSNVPATLRDVYAAAKADIHAIDFASPALTRFWGRTISLRGWVVTPPDYAAHPGQRYPTVYYTQGFGGSLRSLHDVAVARWDEMKAGKAPPMIWVAVDQSSPTGTSEFVDSVNNGPWGQALTSELIPDLERHYRMDARPSGRLLTGHSSGGWAALWLQVNYPKLFGGAWPTSPDPSDFHDFMGIDLFVSGANIYRKPDGTSWPLARDKGEMLVSVEDYTRREAVIGEYGGQMASFEWVFSPRGSDGLPIPMFDRTSGAVDPVVAAYWQDHYDVAERVRRHWPELKRDLDGKIHLTVGTADTFFLDGAAHRLEETMKRLGAKTDFRYVDGRTHFDLYVGGDDPWRLYKTIAAEMYALARPGAKPIVSAPVVEWRSQTSGVTHRLRGVSAVSARAAWASGANGTVLRTVDGGRTWQQREVAGGERFDFRDVDAISDRIAYVLSIGAGESSRIYKTVDAGAHWDLQFKNADPKAFLDAMAFRDEQHGVAFSDSVDGRFVILTTSDGRSWDRVPADRLPPALPGEGAYAASGTNVTLTAGRMWIGTTAGRVLRSADDGRTWTVAATGLATGRSAGIFSIAFRDALHGVVVGGDYQKESEAVDNAAWTSDGGATWTLASGRGLSGFRSVVAFVTNPERPNTTALIAIGPTGADWSDDDGRTWTAIECAGFDTFSAARDGNVGWAAGQGGRLSAWSVR